MTIWRQKPMAEHFCSVRRVNNRIWLAICDICGELGYRDHPADADMLCIEHEEDQG